jgi:Rieske Fe-S protein
MRRRTVLKWISGCLGSACAAVVAIPGVSFVLEALRKSGTGGDRVRRVARLKDLPIGKPVVVPILGAREDAWTVHPDEVLGRVWLVRSSAAAADSASTPAQVAAFNATCPHLGCGVQHDTKENRFLCPCHRAIFGLDGERVAAKSGVQKNPSPRSMDLLDCRLVTDEATQEVWVEVTFQKFEQGLTKKVLKT